MPQTLLHLGHHRQKVGRVAEAAPAPRCGSKRADMKQACWCQRYEHFKNKKSAVQPTSVLGNPVWEALPWYQFKYYCCGTGWLWQATPFFPARFPDINLAALPINTTENRRVSPHPFEPDSAKMTEKVDLWLEDASISQKTYRNNLQLRGLPWEPWGQVSASEAKGTGWISGCVPEISHEICHDKKKKKVNRL